MASLSGRDGSSRNGYGLPKRSGGKSKPVGRQGPTPAKSGRKPARGGFRK